MCTAWVRRRLPTIATSKKHGSLISVLLICFFFVGMRGSQLSGGGVPTGDIVLGSVPERVRGGQEPGPALGHGVSTAGFQTTGAQLAMPACRATYLLHRQQHHACRSLRKFSHTSIIHHLSCFFG